MNFMNTPETDERLLKNDWTVLAVTHNGTVSLLRNMPLKEASKVYAALEVHRVPNSVYYIQASDVKKREIIGPDGWDGCQKAFNHTRNFPKAERIDSGPNEGKFFRSAKCDFCGEWKYEILESPQP